MSLDAAIREALLAVLNSPEGQGAIRRALEQVRPGGADDQAYSVAQVAELGGYAPDTIIQHITDGNLRAHKPRGCREWRIRREDFRAWLAGGGDGEIEVDLDPETVARRMLSKP